jgi:hypothetical protein
MGPQPRARYDAVMRTLALLTACLGCSSHSTPPPGGAPDAAKPDATVDAPSPATPGVFATITGGDHAGSYELTNPVECNVDIETHAYRIFGGGGAIDLSLHTIMQPEAGQQLASPDFWVIVFASPDATYYPQDTGGSCSATIDASWPAARLHFTCTGGAFAITGTGVCPPA